MPIDFEKNDYQAFQARLIKEGVLPEFSDLTDYFDKYQDLKELSNALRKFGIAPASKAEAALISARNTYIGLKYFYSKFKKLPKADQKNINAALKKKLNSSQIQLMGLNIPKIEDDKIKLLLEVQENIKIVRLAVHEAAQNKLTKNLIIDAEGQTYYRPDIETENLSSTTIFPLWVNSKIELKKFEEVTMQLDKVPSNRALADAILRLYFGSKLKGDNTLDISFGANTIICGSISVYGYTYEELNITEWLNKSSTDPGTGLPHNLEQLKPNHALRHLIKYAAKNSEYTATLNLKTAVADIKKKLPNEKEIKEKLTKVNAELVARNGILPATINRENIDRIAGKLDIQAQNRYFIRALINLIVLMVLVIKFGGLVLKFIPPTSDFSVLKFFSVVFLGVGVILSPTIYGFINFVLNLKTNKNLLTAKLDLEEELDTIQLHPELRNQIQEIDKLLMDKQSENNLTNTSEVTSSQKIDNPGKSELRQRKVDTIEATENGENVLSLH